jgi:hypothetical protein
MCRYLADKTEGRFVHTADASDRHIEPSSISPLGNRVSRHLLYMDGTHYDYTSGAWIGWRGADKSEWPAWPVRGMCDARATICMFAPSVIAAKREATRFKRSVHFLTGELTRLCQDCLRQADGRVLTAREMAVTGLHQKGLDAGDAALLADFTKRIAWTLNRMLGRGAVTKQGYGVSARWGVPAT